jgi:ATP-binding cassette subfamily B protein RaxB
MLQNLLDFSGKSRLPVLMQTEAAECGLACLAMVASYHGHLTDLNVLRRRHPVSLKGVTLRGLIQVADQLGLACRPVRLGLDELRQLRLPAILHWDMNHFVVLRTVTGSGTVVVHDPATGCRHFPLAEVSKHLTGVALELTPAEGFTPGEKPVRLPLRAFWGQARGLGHALAQVLVLSVVLEALAVAAPFYMQLTVDEVIARGDLDLLGTLALGFGLMAAIRVAVTALRARVILILQNTLHFQMGARLLHHLIRLPLAFFEKRHIGDILSRFASLEPIRHLLAEGLITAVIDGLMAGATLLMILIYSVRLALVVLAAFALYALLRLALFGAFRRRSEIAIERKAREESALIETLRAMQSLKLFNRESEREGQWLNRHADAVNATLGLGRIQITFKTLNDCIFGLENIITVYLAARLALSETLTVGMVFAFMSYKHSFTEKAVLLVEKALDLRILGLHLDRLSDIALTPLERGHDRPLLEYVRPVRGGIELRNVSFRYAETEPFVLRDVSLTIEPGRFVTIMGPSGAGKTTLIKIMLGLLEPTSGEVLVDGTPLTVFGARAFREQVGAVMQDDQLLSGSIADNICFFDPNFDHEWMIACTRTAGVHDEIMAMPMAYNSLIGDMGNSLSGGQKQRVMLARALYRRPKVLFLDEGTAHLDIEKERAINENLRRLDITRVSIAHRPEITDGTDAILRIGAALPP